MIVAGNRYEYAVGNGCDEITVNVGVDVMTGKFNGSHRAWGSHDGVSNDLQPENLATRFGAHLNSGVARTALAIVDGDILYDAAAATLIGGSRVVINQKAGAVILVGEVPTQDAVFASAIEIKSSAVAKAGVIIK